MTASPFGITLGAPPPVNFEIIKEGVAVGQPPFPHATFKKYVIFFGKDGNVAKVIGRSAPFSNDDYGVQAKGAFEKIKGQLETKYGPSKSFDFLQTGAIWNEDREWRMSLVAGDRVYSSYWGTEAGSPIEQLDALALTFESLDDYHLQIGDFV